MVQRCFPGTQLVLSIYSLAQTSGFAVYFQHTRPHCCIPHLPQSHCCRAAVLPLQISQHSHVLWGQFLGSDQGILLLPMSYSGTRQR